MKKVKHCPITLIFILLLSLNMQPSLAEEQPDNDNTYLHVARVQLSIAFEQYNNGNITESKHSLKKASDWLEKAVKHSKHDKVKNEADKLASEIDRFRLTLSHSSDQSEMIRFWHQASSLITRESMQLINNYVTSLNDSTTLSYLLDAKMHFYLAEHDLFDSHDYKDAVQELNDTLEYLEQADAIARPDLEIRISNLITDIKTLITYTESDKESWKDNKLIDSLDKATGNLKNAESVATPPVTLRLRLIEQNLHQLKMDIQETNIKIKYDLIATEFNRIIKNI